MAFTRMVQQQECVRVVVYGMEVYLSAYQIKEDKMVNILCPFIIIQKWYIVSPSINSLEHDFLAMHIPTSARSEVTICNN